MGDGHPSTLVLRADLADLSGDALAEYEAILFDMTRWFGEENYGTLLARYKISTAYLNNARFDLAIDGFSRLVTDAQRLLGKNFIILVFSRDLAFAHHKSGDLDQAITEYQSVLRQTSERFGEHHRMTVFVRFLLGFAYRDAGRSRGV
jgi:hypothetical protein